MKCLNVEMTTDVKNQLRRPQSPKLAPVVKHAYGLDNNTIRNYRAQVKAYMGGHAMPIQPEDLDQFFADLRKKHNQTVRQQRREEAQMRKVDQETGRTEPRITITTTTVITDYEP